MTGSSHHANRRSDPLRVRNVDGMLIRYIELDIASRRRALNKITTNTLDENASVMICASFTCANNEALPNRCSAVERIRLHVAERIDELVQRPVQVPGIETRSNVSVR